MTYTYLVHTTGAATLVRNADEKKVDAMAERGDLAALLSFTLVDGTPDGLSWFAADEWTAQFPEWGDEWFSTLCEHAMTALKMEVDV